MASGSVVVNIGGERERRVSRKMRNPIVAHTTIIISELLYSQVEDEAIIISPVDEVFQVRINGLFIGDKLQEVVAGVVARSAHNNQRDVDIRISVRQPYETQQTLISTEDLNIVDKMADNIQGLLEPFKEDLEGNVEFENHIILDIRVYKKPGRPPPRRRGQATIAMAAAPRLGAPGDGGGGGGGGLAAAPPAAPPGAPGGGAPGGLAAVAAAPPLAVPGGDGPPPPGASDPLGAAGGLAAVAAAPLLGAPGGLAAPPLGAPALPGAPGGLAAVAAAPPLGVHGGGLAAPLLAAAGAPGLPAAPPPPGALGLPGPPLVGVPPLVRGPAPVHPMSIWGCVWVVCLFLSSLGDILSIISVASEEITALASKNTFRGKFTVFFYALLVCIKVPGLWLLWKRELCQVSDRLRMFMKWSIWASSAGLSILLAIKVWGAIQSW